MPVIPALGRQKQEDGEFKASLGYIPSPPLKKKKRKTKNNVYCSWVWCTYLQSQHLGGWDRRIDSLTPVWTT
jgi:hypothetical protein